LVLNFSHTVKKPNIVFLPTLTNLENRLSFEYLETKKEYGITLKTILYRKELIALFSGRTTF
jgi:hypothetical protein